MCQLKIKMKQTRQNINRTESVIWRGLHQIWLTEKRMCPVWRGIACDAAQRPRKYHFTEAKLRCWEAEPFVFLNMLHVLTAIILFEHRNWTCKSKQTVDRLHRQQRPKHSKQSLLWQTVHIVHTEDSSCQGTITSWNCGGYEMCP